MPHLLRLSFWEREFFPQSKDGKHIQGYEPALVCVGETLRTTNIIDHKRFMLANCEDRELHACEFPFKDTSLNLEDVLAANVEGKRWLEAHQSYFRDIFQETMPLPFSLRLAEMPPVQYTLFNDRDAPDHLSSAYFRRIPEGTLAALPDTCFYALVSVPLKFSDGKFAPNIYFNRNALNPQGKVHSYSLRKFPREKFDYAPGILLGILEENDVSLEQGSLHRETPLHHLLEVTYPVTMGDTQHNPLTIRVEICSQERKNDV